MKRTMKNATDDALAEALAQVARKIDEALEILDLPCRDTDEHAEIVRRAAIANAADDASQVAHAKVDARRHRLIAIAESLRAAKNITGEEIARIGKTEKPEDAR